MSRFGLGFLAGGGIPGNDIFTKVLLHMDGANGGTSFPDVNVGGSAHAWVASSATTGTSSPKFGSAAMNANSGFIRAADSADFNLGTQDFTIECWINSNGVTVQSALIGQLDSGGGSGNGSFYSIMGSAGRVGFGLSNGSSAVAFGSIQSTTLGPDIRDSAWHHVALIRNGSSAALYVDGTVVNTQSFSATVPNSTANFGIGVAGDYTGFSTSNFRFDEFRLSVGIARWTANFTPPTAPYI